MCFKRESAVLQLFLLLFLAFFACSRKGELRYTEKLGEMPHDAYPDYIVNVENNKFVALSNIMGASICRVFLLHLGDSGIKVVKSFDIKKGDAPFEISPWGIGGIGFRNDTLFVFDRLKKHLKLFYVDGQYVGEIKIMDALQDFRLIDDYFIFLSLKELRIYDNTGRQIHNLELFNFKELKSYGSETFLGYFVPVVFFKRDTLFVCDIIQGHVKGIDMKSNKIVYSCILPPKLHGKVEFRTLSSNVISAAPRSGISSFIVTDSALYVSTFNLDDSTKVGIYDIDRRGKIRNFIVCYQPATLLRVDSQGLYYLHSNGFYRLTSTR